VEALTMKTLLLIVTVTATAQIMPVLTLEQRHK
jgi:hypothetical protein